MGGRAWGPRGRHVIARDGLGKDIVIPSRALCAVEGK